MFKEHMNTKSFVYLYFTFIQGIDKKYIVTPFKGYT